MPPLPWAPIWNIASPPGLWSDLARPPRPSEEEPHLFIHWLRISILCVAGADLHSSSAENRPGTVPWVLPVSCGGGDAHVS